MATDTNKILLGAKLSELILDFHELDVENQLQCPKIVDSLHWEWPSDRDRLKGCDADTLRLKACRTLESLDHEEFRMFTDWQEQLLTTCDHWNYDTFSIFTSSAHLIASREGFFLSSRRYPRLQAFLKSNEQCTQLINQLEVLRSQVMDLLKEGGQLNQAQPLGERLLELLLMHAAYDLIEDSQHEVYNTLIRLARQLFSGLSFQQVMRLCQNVHALLHGDEFLILLTVQRIEGRLSFYIGEELIGNLIRLQAKLNSHQTQFELFFNHSLKATHLSEREIGRLLFLHSNSIKHLPANFKVISTKKDHSLFWDKSGLEQSSKSPWNVHLKTHEKSLHVDFSHADKKQSFVIGHGEEYIVDHYSFIYRRDANALAVCPLVDDGLFMKDIQIHFRGNHILKNISASFRTGEMVAVVGPSGCGKSTMLTMLAGMLDRTGGEIIFNGKSIQQNDDFSKICTYIPQDDILFRELTVHESIENSLKLKVKATQKEQNERLRSTIEVLGLERTEFLKIGSEGEKGISGGQRKRVNIGTTIVADMKPILLFDEPTSGLDPATDVEIMQLLRQLSRQGHIVMVVTHNLSAESLAFFDQLMVLDRTGKLQFLGKEQRARYFFNIRSTHLLFQKMKEQSKEDYCEKFSKTPENINLLTRVQTAAERQEQKLNILGHDLSKIDRRPGPISNFKNFLERELRRKSRDSIFLAMCCLQPILISLFIGWNFDGPVPNAIFSLLAATLWIGAISGVREINTEMPQLKRDYLYGTSLFGYMGSKVVSGFGFSAFQVLLLAFTLFWGEGYFDAPFNFNMLGALASLLLLNLFGISLGLFMSASIRSPLAAVGLLPVLLIPLLIMGGALIRHNQVDGVQWWAMKLNPLRMSYESLLFSGQTVLRPSLEGLKVRSLEEQEHQTKLWNDYLDKSALFEKDPDAYEKKYNEVDLNDLFASALNGEDQPKTLQAPEIPSDVSEPELLIHRPDLWLQGQKILPVDPPIKDYFSTNHYPILAPKAFSESLSAQGVTGMFKHENNEEWSVYSPMEYSIIPFLEILALHLAMSIILLLRISRKN